MGKRKRSGSFSKYDDCSKRSDDGDSQEEMDGDSVAVQKGNIANGIRYSARVQEKQEKLRRESSPSKQIVFDATCTITVPMPCQTIAKQVTPVGEDPTEVCPLERTYISQTISISGEKKKKRTWELWSQEDKQLFFEALNEFGKDFDAIQTYLASKLKPRSKGSCPQSLPKNKDQVRHFYYRTWNKISKYLTFPKDMKKAYQELYGLINYGELRKKQRVLNLKTAVKLSELVEKGTSTIKVRGKTFRIKTPVCRALKKLNQLEETDHIRVPCKLCVELVPHDGHTWTSVQRVSHNPRVKVYVPLQRTLASLIIYFEERWKTDQNRLKEEFSLTVFGKPRTRLRFFPVESRDLSVPLFKFSEVTSATKISLSSYVQNCLYQERKQDSSLVSKKFKRKQKIDSELVNLALRDADYLAADADVSDVDGCEVMQENQFRITLRRDKLSLGGVFSGMKSSEFCADQDNSNGLPDNVLWSVHEENANAAAETDAGETDYGFDDNAPSPTECDSGDEDCMDNVIADNNILDGFPDLEGKEERQNICSACKSAEGEENAGTEKSEKMCTCSIKRTMEPESIKCQILDSETTARGFNADEAGALTLGEIYLMLGKSDRLCFEYTWDKCDEDKLREERARNLVDKLVNIARQLKKKRTNRAKISTNATPLSATTILACSKCNHKMESPTGSADFELPLTSASTAVMKDCPGESPQEESPHRTNSANQSQNDSLLDDNKITLHAVVSSDSSPTTEFGIRNEVSVAESSPQCEVPEPVASSLDVEPSVAKKDETTSTQGLICADSTTAPIPDTSSPIVCSAQQPFIASQPGLIELTTLATTSPVDMDSNFRRVASNIKATIIPTSTTILRPVTLTTASITDGNTTLVTCNTGTLSPVATTTTVLLSEPIMFAGIATEATPFVTIQQCSAASISPSSNLASNTPETKFRRPADVPILMKPSSDDRSTNEDGSAKLNVPKPFLDLPKGNRRIGRRPAWKQRVIIPRMLPLLPKPDATTMATLIAIPPVVAAGLSVVPITAENLTSVTTLPLSAELEAGLNSTSLVPPAVTLAPGSVVAVSSILTTVSPNDNTVVTSSMMSGAVASVSGAMNSSQSGSTTDPITTLCTEKPSPSKNSFGVEETLDNLSLSSFMDLSIPESTRFISSELRFDELECSNSSVNLSGMLEETSRKNTRDPSLLGTPKKRTGADETSVGLNTPEKITIASLDAWSSMNEGLDISMGSLFNGNDGMRTNSNEPLTEGDLTFQSVIGDGSLDFESKLNDFTTSLSSRNKE